MSEADVASILEGIEVLKFRLDWLMLIVTVWGVVNSMTIWRFHGGRSSQSVTVGLKGDKVHIKQGGGE